MKKRYELQFADGDKWRSVKHETVSLDDLISACRYCNSFLPQTYRVVQKLGRKVIKVVYPKGVKK